MTSFHARTAVTAIDVALAGDILRVVTSGLPEIASRHAFEALSELRAKHEAFRDFLNQPPIGNPLVNSSLLYPPFSPGTDGTLFLASRFGYAPYAGTALMAAATVLAETRWPLSTLDRQIINLETALGNMEVEIGRKNGIVSSATWTTAAPDLLISNENLRRDSGSLAAVSLVDAGLPYLVADAGALGADLNDHRTLSGLAIELSALACKQFPLAGFGLSGRYDRYLAMFTSKVTANHVEAVWVSDKGEVANSAGGTGALAVLAVCERNGSLVPGQPAQVEAPGGHSSARLRATKRRFLPRSGSSQGMSF